MGDGALLAREWMNDLPRYRGVRAGHLQEEGWSGWLLSIFSCPKPTEVAPGFCASPGLAIVDLRRRQVQGAPGGAPAAFDGVRPSKAAMARAAKIRKPA